ncbi:hypothetical protein JI747_000965 [Chryseobacterium sp. RG1]|uniref:Lipoprotein n=1 Tax=Chryseobacterium tagetis TaxID=2801334 RepID=A0ABS7ZVG5_9FLAO|nr:hypothetical protein [Chryseobacterium tagetis]MCA6065726.1 hypothetical protein [Chryseobacterium tagetis]
MNFIQKIINSTIYIFTIFTVIGCKNPTKEIEIKTKNQIINKENNIPKLYTKQDSIIIPTELGDTLKYSRKEFKNITDQHPEFSEQYPRNPDQTYFDGNDKEQFGSEAGQDTYYILYAYFLKQKNGIQKFSKERQKLINIYSNINSLFGKFENGGTYFGHQYSRILGYAEYSIYLLPKNKNDFYKTYDITKQKELYITSLRQLIEDESKIDFESTEEQKKIKKKELNKIVDKLDILITNNFYLRRAQEFQYSHYEYY